MSLFRNVLVWLLLAVLGAVLAQVLLQDPGYVLVRYGGYDYSATLVTTVSLLLAALCVVGVSWGLLRGAFRDRPSRSRLPGSRRPASPAPPTAVSPAPTRAAAPPSPSATTPG